MEDSSELKNSKFCFIKFPLETIVSTYVYKPEVHVRNPMVKDEGNSELPFTCFKASPSAKPFIWKLVLFTWK